MKTYRTLCLMMLLLFLALAAQASAAPAPRAADREELVKYRADLRVVLRSFKASRSDFMASLRSPAGSLAGLENQWRRATKNLRNDAKLLENLRPPTRRLARAQNAVTRSIRSLARATGQVTKHIANADARRIERAAEPLATKYVRASLRAKRLYALARRLVRRAKPSRGARPPTADAAARCRPVTTRRFKATQIDTFKLSCATARANLKRWLGRGYLPRNQFSWYCARVSGPRRVCSLGNGAAPSFTFKSNRR